MHTPGTHCHCQWHLFGHQELAPIKLTCKLSNSKSFYATFVLLIGAQIHPWLCRIRTFLFDLRKHISLSFHLPWLLFWLSVHCDYSTCEAFLLSIFNWLANKFIPLSYSWKDYIILGSIWVLILYINIVVSELFWKIGIYEIFFNTEFNSALLRY